MKAKTKLSLNMCFLLIYIQQTKNIDVKIYIFLIFMFINFLLRTLQSMYKNFSFGFAHKKNQT